MQTSRGAGLRHRLTRPSSASGIAFLVIPFHARILEILRCARNDIEETPDTGLNMVSWERCAEPRRERAGIKCRSGQDHFGSKKLLCIPAFGQIPPIRIERFHQSDFLGSPPSFDFFLPCDRRADIPGHLVVDKLVDSVLGCEFAACAALVLQHSSRQVVGDANVERAGRASEQVHGELIAFVP